MAIFFKPQPISSWQAHPAVPVLMTALNMPKIEDYHEREQTAQHMIEGTPALSKTEVPGAPINWVRVLIAFGLLGILFIGALWTGDNPHYSKAGETLLHCFELLFTATIGLFGIEATKHG